MNGSNVISDGEAPIELQYFNRKSGSLGERILFNNRLVVVAICLIVTLVLGWKATGLTMNAAFDKMIPTRHPYVANYLANRNQLSGLGNMVRISVETKKGTIYDKT